MTFQSTIATQIQQQGTGMNKLTIVVTSLVILSGCTSSQSELLGEPRTTTENVIVESRGASTPDFKDVVASWNKASASDRSVVNSMDYTVRKGVAELSPRVMFMKNERRTLFFYPRKTTLGSVEPGYAIEYPTYKEIHTLMSK